MTSATSHVRPLGIQTLRPDANTCWSCGTEVAGPADQSFHVLARVSRGGGLGESIQELSAGVVVMLGECDRCQDLRATAAGIVAEFPGLRRLGSQHITAQRFTHALIALAALDTPTVEWSEPAVRSALSRLESVGASMTWASRYSPVRASDAKDDEAASDDRWTFVNTDLLAEARAARLEFLIDGMPPRPQAHPANAACLVCGVDHVDARRQSEAWLPVTGKYSGWLCRECAVYERDGMRVGQAMIERAVFDMLDPQRQYRRRRPDDPILKRSPLWIETGRKPSETRFAHLSLDAVRRSLETTSW